MHASLEEKVNNTASLKQQQYTPPIVAEDNLDLELVGDDLQYPIKAADDFQVLPERPLQLVKPDPDEHKKLVLVDENIRHLHYLKGGVAVVAVVGKFHSGKSFLLNQLMGKHDGFGIGPTVRPQTMGIWMWGKVNNLVGGATPPHDVIEGVAAL